MAMLPRELGETHYRVSVLYGNAYWYETEDAALIAAKVLATRHGAPAFVEEVRVIHEVTPKRFVT